MCVHLFHAVRFSVALLSVTTLVVHPALSSAFKRPIVPHLAYAQCSASGVAQIYSLIAWRPLLSLRLFASPRTPRRHLSSGVRALVAEDMRGRTRRAATSTPTSAPTGVGDDNFKLQDLESASAVLWPQVRGRPRCVYKACFKMLKIFLTHVVLCDD